VVAISVGVFVVMVIMRPVGVGQTGVVEVAMGEAESEESVTVEVATSEPDAATVEPTEAPTVEATAEASQPPPNAEDVTTLTLWYSHEEPVEERILLEMLEQLSDQYPHLSVQAENMPSDKVEREYEALVAAGGGPDLLLHYNTSLGSMSRGSFIEPISEYVTDEDLAQYTVTAIQGMQVDGELYGIPQSARTSALYYNKSLDRFPAHDNRSTACKCTKWRKTESDCRFNSAIWLRHRIWW
jgi:maltose-binding protein MalE